MHEYVHVPKQYAVVILYISLSMCLAVARMIVNVFSKDCELGSDHIQCVF